MSETVLVTGATGLLGRTLIGRLAQRDGIRVLAVSTRGGAVDNVPVTALELTSAEAVDEWLRLAPVADTIFHLAARIPGPDDPDGKALEAANLGMTEQVARIAAKHRAHVVYASSAYIYEPDPAGPLTERSPIKPATWYHASKHAGEQLLSEATPGAASLRITSPYGAAARRPSVLTTFLERARRSEGLLFHGSGRRSQDFVHVEDVADAMLAASVGRARGAFNIGSGRSVDMLTLANLVQRAVSDSRSEVRASGQPDPQEDVRWAFDITHARDTFGYVPRVELTAGLCRLAEVG